MLRVLLATAALLCSTSRAQDFPQNFQATVVSPTSVNVTWDPPADTVEITYYDVEYNQSTFSEIPSLYSVITAGLETELLLENLEENVEYSIMVRVLSGLNFLSFSPTLFVTTLEAAPSAPPRNLTVETLSPSQLHLSWLPPPPIDINGRIDHYIIRYRTTATSASITSVAGSTHSRSLTGLDAFSAYTVEVAAFTVGMGPYAVGTATTREDVPGGPPTDLRGSSNSSTSIMVMWDPPEPELLRGLLRSYTILYSPANSSGNALVQVEPKQTFRLLTGLRPFSNYSVQVAAVTIGVGPYSSPIYITTQPTPVENTCLIISDLQVSSTRSTDSQSGVKLTVDWSAELPVLDGCTHGYNLSYSADQTPPYPDGRRQVVRTQTETLRGDQTNYTIDSALPFAEYTVMIHAFEGEDEGETLQQTLRTIAIEPSAVTNLSAVATSHQSIHVSWSLPVYPNSPISHYLLYHRAANTIQLPPIGSSGYVQHIVSNDTEFTLTDLQEQTNFAIHVQAVGKTSDLQGLLPGLVTEELLVQTLDTEAAASSGSSSSTGAIVGAAVGGVVVLALVVAVTVLVIVFLAQRHKRAKFKIAYFSRENQGPSALIGTTTVSNPLAFDMEDCMAYIPNTDSNQRQQEAGQPDVDQSNEPGYARLQRQSQHGGDPGMQHQSLHSSEPGYASLQRQSQYGSEPEYANIGVNRDPTRPHSILDDDGYEVIPI